MLLALACLLYVLSPIDAVPDFTPVLGWLDDLLAAAVTLILLWRGFGGKLPLPDRGEDGTATPPAAPADDADHEPDPYQVLGLRSEAGPELIRKAYREMMAQYHPDKVAHLGEELKRTAHRKTLEIRRAYERLGGL
ncbi:MAG: DUF1232 domain-containing protein [Elusimicrobia bacterium]|nr:DUF1232 domain-containing protein [Elusimicrobiota bacterium]